VLGLPLDRHPRSAKFRLSALAQYLRCRRGGRTVFVVCNLSSKLVVRLTIHGDQDRRLEASPWSLDVVAYVAAVLLRRESGCRPLTGIDPKTRALDVLMIYDFLTVSVRDVVAARVVRNFTISRKSMSACSSRARVLVAKVVDLCARSDRSPRPEQTAPHRGASSRSPR
jgi:hypothetical protein